MELGWSSEVLARFNTLYADAQSSDRESKIVSTLSGIIKILKDTQSVEVVQMKLHRVGIHPMNRGGKRMSATTMNCKGSKIISVGVSKALCNPERAWCCEQDPIARESYHWTVEVAKQSPMFAVPADSICAGSVGCSHLAQFLNAVQQRRPTNEKRLQGDQGNIDAVRLCSEDVELADLLENGLTWSMIPLKVLKQFPKLPAIFERGLNVEHHVGEGETWDQQLLAIATKASESAAISAEQGNAVTVNWENVGRAIRASVPPGVADIPAHILLCKKYGGGEQQLLTKELINYINVRMPAGRKVSGGFIQTVAQHPLATDSQIVRVLHACIKVNATCPDNACDDKCGRLLTFGDVKLLQVRLKEEANRVEGIITRLRDVVGKSGCDALTEIGDVEVGLVTAMFNKHIEKKIVDDVAAEFLKSFFGPDATDVAHVEPVANMVQFSDTGVAINVGQSIVMKEGFKKGSTIQSKIAADGPLQQLRIAYINADGSVGAKQLGHDGNTCGDLITITMDKLLGAYKVVTKVLEADDRKSLFECPGMQVEIRRAAVVMAIASLKNMESSNRRIQKEPERSVFATGPAAIGEVKFVACTSNIKIKTEDDTNARTIATVTASDGAASTFVLSMTPSKTHTSTFFTMKTTDKVEASNMKVEHVSVIVEAPGDPSEKFVVGVPIATLTKAVDVDSEYVMYQQKAVVQKKKRKVAWTDEQKSKSKK